MSEHELSFDSSDTPLITVPEALAHNEYAIHLHKLRLGAAALVETLNDSSD